MKTTTFLLVFLLVAFSATAQKHNKYDLSNEKSYKPDVNTIWSHQADTIYNLEYIITKNSVTKENAISDYHETHRYGHNQGEKPRFIFTTKDNVFSFAVGGAIKLISSYDFNGISNSIDFVPSSIAVPDRYNSRQKFNINASTSTIYLKAIANTKALGRVVIYMDTEFRGGAANDYKPSLKTAYISFLGLTIGRDVTTFCDLSSAPKTIDVAGPNAYTFNYTTLIRYEHTFYQNRFRVGASLEMPNLNGTYGDNFEPIPQRIPNVPIYLQYMWDEKKSSHIRASAIFRDLYAYDTIKESSTSLLGWGVQLSGNIKWTEWMRFMFNGVYGEGITPYIQDIGNSGLDFMPNPSNVGALQTIPMYGVQGGVQFSITQRLQASGGLSKVQVCEKNGYEKTYPYKEGIYAFGNVFYKLTPRCMVAGEYLYGSRENMDHMIGSANRINLMFQCSF